MNRAIISGMKFSYAIDPARRMIVQRYEGRCSLRQATAAVKRVWADPGYCKSMDGFIDLRNMTPDVAFEDLGAFIEFLRERPETGEGRYAAVTASPILTACCMLYQKAMAHRHAFAVFSSEEGARAYLGWNDALPVLREEEIAETAQL